MTPQRNQAVEQNAPEARQEAGPGCGCFDGLVLLRGIEVARILGVSRSKAYEMMADGTLPVIRIGRAVRVPKRALAKWVEDNTETAA